MATETVAETFDINSEFTRLYARENRVTPTGTWTAGSTAYTLQAMQYCTSYFLLISSLYHKGFIICRWTSPGTALSMS